MGNFLSDYIAKIQSARGAWEDYDFTAINPAGEPPQRMSYDVTWEEPSENNLALVKRGTSLDVSRKRIDDALWEYLQSDSQKMLLFTGDPGIGKSTTAIKTAQRLAKQGKRVLYLMPRHDYWQDIVNNVEYERGLWYHWIGTNGVDEWETPMCRYADSTAVWTGKGYPLMEACKALCVKDEHIQYCPYRRQSHRKEPIIAGVHNHAQTGLAIKKFDVVFIDELPIGAFLTDRFIPARFIDIGGRGEIGKLLQRLTQLSQRQGVISGKPLLDLIGPTLTEIYDNISMGGSWLPVIPEINTPRDIDTAREWYIYDLLLLLVPEHMAWQAGESSWLERVRLSNGGLHLLQKKPVWKDLPPKAIAMDATGIPIVYEKTFNRRVEVVSPRPKKVGRIFQIAERSFGISTATEDTPHGKKMSSVGEKMLALGDLIAHSKPLADGEYGEYKSVGVITYKTLVPYAEAIFGVGNVLHFGGNRGTNTFVDKDDPVDCVIVLGTPMPPESDMLDMYSRLTFNPDKPEESEVKSITRQSTAYGFGSIRSMKKTEYHYINEQGLAPYRLVSGFWSHGPLHDVMRLYRDAELRQSAHRGRVLTRNCDVWLVTTARIDEELDGLWQSPNDCLNIPPDIAWQAWTKHRWWVMGQQVITPDGMSNHAGVTRQWAGKWLKSLAAWKPDTWRWTKDPNHTGRGRPKMRLERLDIGAD